MSPIATVVALVGLAASLAVPSVAHAGPGDTIVTFAIAPGTLDISGQATADLGTVTGTVVSGSLGLVTVTDTRGLPDASWVAGVTSTDFTTGSASATETLLSSSISYWSGPASTTGDGTFTAGQAALVDAQALGSPRTAFSHTGGTGSNSAAWSAELDVDVPTELLAGTYTGTVTHSVA
jgi:hypothetical protein